MTTTNDNSPSLKSFYPFPKFRPGIEEALDKIDEAKDKKYVIIKGRTGCGKSAIAVALSRKYNCHILTASKVLQDQYTNTPEFDAEFAIKGKSNYTCAINGKPLIDAPCASKQLFKIEKNKGRVAENIDTPSQLKAVCKSKKQCEYYQKRFLLSTCGGGFLNYDLALSVKIGAASLDDEVNSEIKAIVLDEAHNFIDKLLEFHSLEYSRNRLETLVGVRDAPNQTTYVAWLEKIQKAAIVQIELTSSSKTREQLTNLKERCASIIGKRPLPGDFHVEVSEDTVTIKPLRPKDVVAGFLSRFDKVFFLSATIDDRFANILNLKESDTFKILIDSNFPIAKRPIVFPNNIDNINFATKLDSKSPSIQVLNAILKNHNGQKGIIHTGNYRVFNALQLIYGADKRFTWVEQGTDKGVLLKAHALAENSILVSPSMMEGVDLHGDLARWQVIFKVPFPARTPYQIALEEQLPGFYDMQTRNMLVQSYGRAVRSAEDWATTYVLDGSLKMIIPKIDGYFKEALRFGDWNKLIDALNTGKIKSNLNEEQDRPGPAKKEDNV